MPLVIDASISASWAFADELSPIADKVAEILESELAAVPRIWWYEVRNLLIVNERRKRISKAESESFLSVIARLPIQIDSTFNEAPVLDLARKYGLSFYDAAYLELAQRRGLTLATLDRALQTAATTAGISILT